MGAAEGLLRGTVHNVTGLHSGLGHGVGEV